MSDSLESTARKINDSWITQIHDWCPNYLLDVKIREPGSDDDMTIRDYLYTKTSKEEVEKDTQEYFIETVWVKRTIWNYVHSI